MNQTVPNIRVRVGEPYDATAESQGSCSNRSTTTTRVFLDILHAARPNQQLVFQLNEAPLVAAGYHVTELKAVTCNTSRLAPRTGRRSKASDDRRQD